MVLSDFEPKGVFKFFEEICGIPHGSHNTGKIADYCENFARERGLEYTRDELNNIIIKKPSENEGDTPVIIQGHLDMVCESEPGYEIDFEKDGLTLEVKDGYIGAKGTTLGADDGIAVAMALALLDDDTIVHHGIEAVFTVDEEVGMTGAAAIDLSGLKSGTVMNIDSEEEGVLTAGCAGGVTVRCLFPVSRREKSGGIYTIRISGLTGGHSGVEIGKGRANAAKLAAYTADVLMNEGAELISVNSGTKDNAIPSFGELTVAADFDVSEKCGEILAEFKGKYPAENIEITVSASSGTAKIMENGAAVTEFINSAPNGVQKMSGDVEGLVQTSLNLGILQTSEESVCVSFSMRSSSAAEKAALAEEVTSLAEKYGAEVSSEGDYPPWEYNEKSRLREIMSETYFELYGKKPKIEIIHAGLECGLLSQKLKNPDCVSFGPNILDIHTPSERLEIESVRRTWELVLKTLEKFAQKGNI